MARGRCEGPVSCRKPSAPLLPPLCSDKQTPADTLGRRETTWSCLSTPGNIQGYTFNILTSIFINLMSGGTATLIPALYSFSNELLKMHMSGVPAFAWHIMQFKMTTVANQHLKGQVHFKRNGSLILFVIAS